MIRQIIFTVVSISLMALPGSLLASGLENYSNSGRPMHYVRDGANGDGSSWSNALGDLPATLQRGHVYFVADGNYNWPDLNDAVSGTNYIYIVKATADDHGSNEGWSNSYGDGQAITGSFTIYTSYYVIDGQVRSSGTSGYGFKVDTVQSCSNSGEKVIRIEYADYIQLAYLELEHCGYSYTGSQDILYLRGSSSNYVTHLTVSYSWFHNTNRTHVFSWYANNWLFEYCWFTERYNQDSFAVHGESFSINHSTTNANNIIRYSTFRNNEGTTILGIMDWGVSQGGMEFYGNVFYTDPQHVADGFQNGSVPTAASFDCTNGAIADTGSDVHRDFNIYNNTFVDLNGAAGLAINNGNYSGIVARNNLWVGCSNVSIAANIESNNTRQGTSALFVNYNNNDFRLRESTDSGYVLNTPYNVDVAGIIRGSDGLWDRGAFEYGGDVYVDPDPDPTEIPGIPPVARIIP